MLDVKKISPTAKAIIQKLQAAGYQAYLVGGAVRDLLLKKDPLEYDITTSAKPEEVSKLFSKVVPTGIAFGTVTVILDEAKFEVTTFRADERYQDGRHPESLTFSNSIHADLSRRDFTMNALAYDPLSQEMIDDFEGLKDIKETLIRSVGDPLKRFAEDGLRPLRACRLAAKLNFKIEENTFEAIAQRIEIFKKVAPERVREELFKILNTNTPSIAFDLMQASGLLGIVLPEILIGREVSQPRPYHKYDVYWHNLKTCDAIHKEYPLIRLAGLLHDIGKPATKKEMTFYNHDRESERMAEKILIRLRFSQKEIEFVLNLIKNHMFHYTPEWTDSAVRRFMRKVGLENLEALFELRRGDVMAMDQSDGLDHIKELKDRIQKIIASENALHIRDLKLNGEEVMKLLKIAPGPEVGEALSFLLEKVLDDPKLNEKETLKRLLLKR